MGDCPLNQLENLFVFCHCLGYRKLAGTRILPKTASDRRPKNGPFIRKVRFQIINLDNR